MKEMFLSVFCLLCLNVCFASDSGLGGEYSLSGHAVVRGQGVDSDVSLHDSDGNLLLTVSTNDGSFVFDSLQTGGYTLVVNPKSNNGYKLVKTIKEVNISSSVEGLVINLWPRYKIEGFVTVLTLPVDSVRVQLFDVSNNMIDEYYSYGGRFEFDSLVQGQYNIIAIPEGFYAQFYMNTSLPQVNVIDDVDSLHIKLDLFANSAFSIEGSVHAGGLLEEGAKVELYDLDTNLVDEVYSNNDGFLFESVVAGKYLIKAYPSESKKLSYEGTFLPFAINVAGNVSRLSIELQKNILIGVNENVGLKIYPNPVKDYLIVESALSPDEQAVVDILNEKGEIMRFPLKKVNGKSLDFDVSNLPNGLYIITLCLKKGNAYYGSFVKR